MVKHLFYPHFSFLADRTTVLVQSLLCDRLAFVCLSVCRLSVRNVLWLNGASWSRSCYWQPKEVVYEKSIGTKINDLDLCLEVVSRSCQPLRYIRRWISQKPLKIDWFQRTIN